MSVPRPQSPKSWGKKGGVEWQGNDPGGSFPTNGYTRMLQAWVAVQSVVTNYPKGNGERWRGSSRGEGRKSRVGRLRRSGGTFPIRRSRYQPLSPPLPLPPGRPPFLAARQQWLVLLSARATKASFQRRRWEGL